MFTGIVEGKQPVVEVLVKGPALHLSLDLGRFADGVAVGDSVCVAGCCLTVSVIEDRVATFHLMGETLSLTTFGELRCGSQVNVERSLRLGDRLGGHLVSGHLDGVGLVADIIPGDGQTDLVLALPPDLSVLVVPKGSISIDGVSMTVAGIDGPRVTVCLIPHTLEVTTLGELQEGDRVHLEMDMIGKWVQRFIKPHTGEV